MRRRDDDGQRRKASLGERGVGRSLLEKGLIDPASAVPDEPVGGEMSFYILVNLPAMGRVPAGPGGMRQSEAGADAAL
jgi:hypothetical protein